MQLSTKAENLLKEIEQLSLQPYDDAKGLKSAPIKSYVIGATIGYGYLISKGEWDKYKGGITKEQADQLFNKTIQEYVNGVNKRITATLTQNQFDALVILCYNIGVTQFDSSSVAKMVNREAGSNYKTLDAAWLAFNKTQGKVSQGLINRRQAELNIYNKGIYARW